MKKFKDEINPHDFSDSISVAFQNGMKNASDLLIKFIDDKCNEPDAFSGRAGIAKTADDLRDAIKEYLNN